MDIDRELKKKLMHAENIDDIKNTLKENEIDMTDEEMNSMWEDIKKHMNSGAVRVDDEQLATVSGGAFGFGEDAPDGHEIGCWAVYWSNWDDFYNDSANAAKHCRSNNHGPHEFEKFRGENFLGWRIIPMKRCIRCGYETRDQ